MGSVGQACEHEKGTKALKRPVTLCLVLNTVHDLLLNCVNPPTTDQDTVFSSDKLSCLLTWHAHTQTSSSDRDIVCDLFEYLCGQDAWMQYLSVILPYAAVLAFICQIMLLGHF